MALVYILVPEFQVAASVFVPVWVEHDKGIDASMQFEAWTPIKIGVNAEETAGGNDMNAGSVESWIRNDVSMPVRCSKKTTKLALFSMAIKILVWAPIESS